MGEPAPSKTVRDISAIMNYTTQQIREIGEIAHSYANESEPHPLMLARIKSALENQRSVLDYVAYAIVKKHGKTRALWKVSYPWARQPEQFECAFLTRMPGVVGTRPDIREAVSHWQPHDREWLRALGKLVNKNKHRHLAKVSKLQLKRVTGEINGRRGESWVPDDSPIGADDLVGQFLPADEPNPPGREMYWVGWLFEDLPRMGAQGVPVVQGLQLIQEEVRTCATALIHVSGLWS